MAARSPRWRLRDLLPDLARTYDVPIIADAYTTTMIGLVLREGLPTEPTALFVLQDNLAGFSYRWDYRDRLIRLRSRTWFLDRPREIPADVPAADAVEQARELPLDDDARN